MKLSTNLTTGVTDSTVADYLNSAELVNAVPSITIDWNLNRDTSPTADNTPSEDTNGYDIESFPISSIYQPRRPTKGLNKAIVGQAVTAHQYASPDDIKFYIGSPDDNFKYWTSPVPTDDSGAFPLYTDSKTMVRPRVEYSSVLNINKIVIKFETTWATPNDFNVQVKTTTGGSYTNIAGTSPAIDNLGVCTLYFNGTAWVTTRPDDLVITPVAGIQLEVRTMKGGTNRSGAPVQYLKKNYDITDPSTLGETSTHITDGTNSNFNLISIEPHLEADFSDRLVTESNTFDFSTVSTLYPIGTLTSNEGTLTFANDDQLLNETNTDSPYYGLIHQNAEVNMQYIFTIDGVEHSVQQFKMYTGLWAPQDDGTVQVPITDYSKFFNEDTPRAFMWEGLSATELVWRICDAAGFIDYDIQVDDITTDHTIPVFWTDGTRTVWDIFNDIAEASQCAIYFDENGRLQVRLRDAAFTASADPVATLYGHDVDDNLANIADWSYTQELQNNKITVTYKATDWKVGTNGKPALDYVWQPDGDTVVRSSPLVRNITDSSTALYIDPKKAVVWPYTSKVQVDGEIIQYDGKQFVYWTGNGTVKNTVWLESLDDLNKYKKLSVNTKNHSTLTGALRITERGVWNSDQRNHSVTDNIWTTWMQIWNSGSPNDITNPSGFRFHRDQSTASINTPPKMKSVKDLFLAYHGSPSDTGYHMVGTRLMYDEKTGPDAISGIGFQLNGSNMDGYYVQVIPTPRIKDKDRKTTNEVQIWSRVSNKWTLLDKGTAIALRPTKWYDIDVYITSGTQDRIEVFLNGQSVSIANTTGATKQPASARIGMYARGKTRVTFEYIYGVARSIDEPEDDYGFWDLVNGAMRGGEWELEIVWQKRTRVRRREKKNSTKNKTKYGGYLFDEFGPYVHEVREFNVKFDPAPVQYSQLYLSNSWDSAPVEYRSDAFSAYLVVANTARQNAVINGDDSLLFNGSNPVTQIMAVLGRDLIVQDDQTVVIQNDASILIDGEVDSELTSDWIQSEEMANAIGTWMNAHWSLGVDQLDITLFGNPCYQLGDVVAINWPLEGMSPETHKYFVVGIVNNFTAGLTTELTLRRVNTAS